MKFNVLDFLLPREVKFFHYMQEQGNILTESSKEFRTLLYNLSTLKEYEVKSILAKIKAFEIKGDEFERKIIDELNKTFITPIDREDIHLIAISTDRALDILDSIAQKIDVYAIRQVPKNVCNFSDIILSISLELNSLFKALERKDNIETIIRTIHEYENKADYLFHISMAELFTNPNPIEIIKFKELYEHMEAVVDSVDYIGKLVRGVVVKTGSK